MKFFVWGRPFFFVLAVLIVWPHLSIAGKNKAEISEIRIDKTGRNLEISFYLDECFTPKMEEAIRNGVSTTFRIIVAIERPSILIWKAQVVDFALEHTIKFNRLNNEFQVHLPEHPEKVLVTKDFEEAKRLMSTVDSLPVIPTCWLHKNQEYCLKVKAELSKVELPLFFRYILFWVTLWDFDTDWRKVAFQMQP